MKTHSIELEIDGVGVPATVNYTAEWYRGWHGKREGGVQMEPDEPAGWQIDIESVVIDGSEIDLLPYLEKSDRWIDELTRELAEVENG